MAGQAPSRRARPYRFRAPEKNVGGIAQQLRPVSTSNQSRAARSDPAMLFEAELAGRGSVSVQITFRSFTMKQLLGAACAAFALSSSVWAQAPMSPSGVPAPRPAAAPPTIQQQSPRINMPEAGPGPAPSSEADEVETLPRAATPRRRGARASQHAARPAKSPADHMADQLNRQELERLPPASATPAAVPPGRPAR